MSTTPNTPNTLPGVYEPDAAALLTRVLKMKPTEHVSVCWKLPGGDFDSRVVPVAEARALIAAHARHECWFSVNTLNGKSGRRRAEDVARLTALFADIDIVTPGVKEKGCRDMAHAWELINAISQAGFGPPTAVVNSGHGLHPYWPISDGEIEELFTVRDAAEMLGQFRDFVLRKAAEIDAVVDSNVFEPARILRAPGTLNLKDPAAPVLATAQAWEIRPERLTIFDIRLLFAEHRVFTPTTPATQAIPKAGGAVTTPVDSPFGTSGDYYASEDEWAWDMETDWLDVLPPGWSVSKEHRDGHVEYARPGGSSTRSSHSHPAGCEHFPSTNAPSPMTFFSATAGEFLDRLQSRRGHNGITATKLTIFAERHHGGDVAAAREALGINFPDMGGVSHHDDSLPLDVVVPSVEEVVVPSANPFHFLDLPGKGTPKPPVAPKPEVETPEPLNPITISPEELSKNGTRSTPNPNPSTTPTGICSGEVEWITTPSGAAERGWVVDPRIGLVDAEDMEDPWDKEIYPLGCSHTPDLVKAVFDFNDTTRWLLHISRSLEYGMVPAAPLQVLVTYFMRCGMRAPVGFMPTSDMPLSFAMLRFGDSGSGKTVSFKRARRRDFTPAVNGGAFGLSPDPSLDSYYSLGSGQALLHLLTHVIELKEDPNDREKVTGKRRVWNEHPAVWIEAAEMRKLLKNAQNGAGTHIDELNKTWSMEKPGDSTITHGTEELIEQAFNVFFSGGFQSEVWDALSRESNGFIQRVLLVGSDDLWRSTADDGVPPPPVGFTPPGIPNLPKEGTFDLCPEIMDEFARSAAAMGFARKSEEAKRSTHHLQMRLRFACLAALTFGTTNVDADLWKWTVFVMEAHRRTTAHVEASAATLRGNQSREKGKELAHTKLGERAELDVGLNEAMQEIIEMLDAAGDSGMTRRDVQRRLGRRGGHLNEAEKILNRRGLIVSTTAGRSVVLTLVRQGGAETAGRR